MNTMTNPHTGQPETWEQRVARMNRERGLRDNPKNKPQLCADLWGTVR